MSKSTHGPQAISEAHRRLEHIKETHKKKMFEDDGESVLYDEDKNEYVKSNGEDAIGIATHSRHRLIVDICEEIEEFFPEPEPMEVRRYRALVLSLDSVRQSADLREVYGDPLRVMENVALEYREEALGIIENRLEVSKPTEEGDADVLYIRDTVSKMQTTIAVGGFSLGEDMRVLENHIKMFSEQVLCDPIPDRIPSHYQPHEDYSRLK